MFRFKYIELYHWDYWKRPLIPLNEQIVTVAGPNGSGKTTFLDSLRTLLNTKQSGKRNITKYIHKQHNRAAIKAVVSNVARTKHGKRPFSSCMSDEVTLVVTFTRSGADLKKRFFIDNGDAPLEEFVSGERNGVALKPTDYSHRLSQAGLSKSVLKVLALEQGATDELCEKSPQELLNLVFDVFGDTATLNNYRNYLEEQKEASTEVAELKKDYETDKKILEYDRDRIERYKKNSTNITTLAHIRSVEHIQAQAGSLFKHLSQKEKELEQTKQKLNELLSQLNEAKKAEFNANETHGSLKNEQKKIISEQKQLQEQFASLAREINQLESSLNEFVRIEKEYTSLKQTDPEKLTELIQSLTEKRETFIIEKNDLSKKLKLFRNELEEIEATQNSHYIPKIKWFQDELEKANIQGKPLAKLIEIKNEKWQLAIESLLGRDRFDIFVEESDLFSAKKVGKACAYKSYISSYEPAKFSDKIHPKSALAVVEFLDERVPNRIYEMLNQVKLVSSLDDTETDPEFSIFMAEDGYRVDKRGGISRQVKALFCGQRAIRERKETLQSEIQRLSKDETLLETNLNEIKHHLPEAEKSLEIIRRYQTLTHELDGANEILDQKKSEFAETETAQTKCNARFTELQLEIDDTYKWVQPLVEKRTKLEQKESEASHAFHAIERELTETRQKFDYVMEHYKPDWDEPTSPMIQALSLKETEEKIKDLEKEINGFENENESHEHPITENHVKHFEARETQIEQKYHRLNNSVTELKDIEERTNRARQTYIDVLNGSINFYKKNVEQLAEIAGANVSINLPKIENSIESINSAGLEVRFAFDGKKLHSIDSSESSGGQKVIESLVLLISLLKDERDTEGGFVFIDEPFAHLDVVNVNRVGEFLRSTGAQYIITTPTTQNIGVYGPSKLFVQTIKKDPAADFALPPNVMRE